ncbi:unnamed protein product [Protopolystoma xenopodis]|uniref:UFSP1/2/DUB catalytic domain-containing protein n=1 Tax=Protopolystoma xenopodis TaxID=117903 RepID=A0A448WSW2_9PLAT|nr:unnamed protein product [Protopolystoma xenopodis]
MRRGLALYPSKLYIQYLGPDKSTLVTPHLALQPPKGLGVVSVLQGRYTYKHYLQDEFLDRGWGCAYRSLQTLISWLMWQEKTPLESPGPLPTHIEIQRSLVRIGDKPASFAGSKQWIGSLEVSFCIQELYGIQCRLLPISRGSEMSSQAGSLIAEHFASGGGPVMVGGGQLAHTIIGIQLKNMDYDSR